MRQIIKNHDKLKRTCRNSCEWFDPLTESCTIRLNVNVDSELELRRCMEFEPKWDNSNHLDEFFYDEDDFVYNELTDDDEIFHELIGMKEPPSPSKYPIEPDYPANRDDAVWYVSPDRSFGCWIINKHGPMSIPKSRETAKKGWGKNVYKSPIPLHNHNTSPSIASKMAWYIDEEGYGQYVLLINGRISQISAPKPSYW